MLYVVDLPDGREVLADARGFHEFRWEQIERKIRQCCSATRGEQLLLARYCRLYDRDPWAETLWMIAAGVPVITIIPELMPTSQPVA